MELVTIKKFSENSGYSEEAIRQKLKKGIWRFREHAYKGPDGRIMINVNSIYAWIKSNTENTHESI